MDTECPQCGTVFPRSGKAETLTCPTCEVVFPSPETLKIPEYRDAMVKALKERAANPTPVQDDDKIDRLHRAAITEVLLALQLHWQDLDPATLTVNNNEGGSVDFKVTADGYLAGATLWKGLLYDPRRYDAQINIHFTELRIPIEIYVHSKGEAIHRGWKRIDSENKISPLEQMYFDGDIIL